MATANAPQQQHQSLQWVIINKGGFTGCTANCKDASASSKVEEFIIIIIIYKKNKLII